mgnify:CR=1 FL=1
MIDLKSYFHDKYQGGESFIENVILPIFGEDKYEDAYEEDVMENNPELITMAQNTGVAQILRLGTINIPMNPTDVFDITVNDHVQMKRNRVAVQQLIRRIMSTYSSAFMVFHYDDDDKWDWRFTFCSKQGNNHESTDAKRYTFLLGPNQSCRTAADNFKKLASKGGDIELSDIVAAFDVEALSDEFFDKYKEQYEKFVMFITGKKFVKKDGGWKEKVFHEPHPQMYADFGGYSEMAIGVSLMLGFKVAENFKRPFFTINIAQYWSRWHMSLTSWLTDYVFMPLNIKLRDWGTNGTIAAIMLNMTFIGMWHGADWTFFLFGIYHGLWYIPLMVSGQFFKKTKIKVNSHGWPTSPFVTKMIANYLIVTFGAVCAEIPYYSFTFLICVDIPQRFYIS